MSGKEKLTADRLKITCPADFFDFETTADIKPFSDGIIGQNRAIRAMDLGLKIEQQGFNIYMSGDVGTGRTTYARKLAEKKAREGDVPSDLCYVYNFDEPEKPRALCIPPGYGSSLKKDMSKLIEDLKEEIPGAFSGEEFEEQHRQVMNSYQQQSSELMEEFEREIREQDFALKNTQQGPVPVPLKENGEPMTQEEFQQLSEEEKKELREESQQIKAELEQVMRKIRELKAEAQSQLTDEKVKIALTVIQPVMEHLKKKYHEEKAVTDYLEAVQQDITENIDKFQGQSQQGQQPQFMELLQQNDDGSFFTRYEVNLLVNNQNTEGAPVVFETNPTYYNLFGKIEGEGQLGTIKTDFTMIKGGAFQQANGGYLIVKARDVLTNPYSWETLKRTLINQQAVIENIGEQYRTVPIKTLKPEPIPIDLKVIMIGDPMLYQLLFHYDEEFEKLFKIRADFDVKMDRTDEHVRNFASFIASICEREGTKHFTADAVSRVIEYSSRLAGDTRKISTRFNELIELLYEANAWSEGKYITADDLLKAVEEKEKRANLAEEKIQEMIERGHILVDVDGETVGQVNGLAVYQTGQYTFGRPSRITARTFLGQGGVVNIERKAELSGKVHNKGVMILSGYLGGRYAQDKPLSLSATLAFEQSYGGVDGDSASCAELIALISSISGLPVRQELAITGSMDQKGRVQPIGGVNEKIEGFYKVCRLKGLTGEQGVVIPVQNEENLMLKDEVIEAVREGKFNIYTVKEIDEAIELMMKRPAAEVHQRVEESLRDFARKAVQYKTGSRQEGESEGVIDN